MTLTHSLSPIPDLVKGLKDKSKLKGVSREWIYLSLINNFCMFTYSIVRNLSDSVLGCIIGKPPSVILIF